LHKNHYPPLPNFGVIALYISGGYVLRRGSGSPLHKNHYPPLPNFGVIALYSVAIFKA